MLGIYMEKAMRVIKIDAIRIDGGTQCRVVIDQPTVYAYVENMKEGDVFPALETVFDGSTYWLTDGFHRYHAYKLLGIKEVQTEYIPGTLQDAKERALQANSTHGKPLTNKDKRNKVKMALEIDGYADKSNYELAKICKVSQPFIAAYRNPTIKEKQAENVKKHYKEKKSQDKNTNSISSEDLTKPDPNVNYGPSEEEIKASEMALEADQETMYKLLESDDALKTAHEELKKANLLTAQLTLRIHGLMNEKNEAIKMVKKLQAENDKLKAKK
jgi:ParB-like chromosome segregation protein Spo0J